jgi:hypothetical protein
VLDHRPLREPLATQIELAPDGRLHVYRYSVQRLEIALHAEQRIEPSVAERFFAPFAGAESERVEYTGTGVEQGDPFSLRLARRAQPALERTGLVHLASEEVRAAVAELLALGQGLVPAPGPARVHLRAEPIEPRRLAKLRAAQRVRFHTVAELTAQLGPAVQRAVAGPRAFHALEKDQESVLPVLEELGRELFVLDGEAGYQLASFTTKSPGESR